MIIYKDNDITIVRKDVFGKIGLSGYNKKNGATITDLFNDPNKIDERIKRMINELKKDNCLINLTEKLTKIENNFLKTTF